ncbi:hypothetical protein GALMADRAFT_1050690 [Galerina marginata CBS 339.88]|uniref:BCAS3 WD40 domain-containing protein n=1 Tax=Galerina marginata (strain CBS 339.88) TaxID=685588 RepID=A0A067SAV3_GALM3|nr:hypothetical protein GALMADRAFT_1050690 [Galerina marginata CBS 339.88]
MESVDQASDADEFDSDRERVATLVLYSLRHHRVVKTLRFAGLASTFVANEFVVVVGTTAPPTIHILSASTFQILHVIPASALEPFAHPSLHSQAQGHRTTTSISHSSSALFIPNTSAPSNLNANPSSSSTQYQQHQQQQQSVSLTGLSIDERDYNTHTTTSSSHAERRPAPVIALSHRLLAYASPSPAVSPSLLSTLTSKASRRLSSSSSASASGRSNAASSLSSSPFNLGAGLGGVGAGLTGGIGGIGAGIEKLSQVTQADVGNAALRVGESMFSGMKFLGGKALEVAKSRVGAGMGSGTGVGARGLAPGGTRRAVRLVSKSAPGDSGVGEEALRERYSSVALAEAESRDRVGTTTVAPQTKPAAEPGHYVTVVDLGPLFSSSSSGQGSGLATPKKIDEFNASRSRPVAGLSFAHDGTSVGAILRDGHSVKVFKLRPSILLPGSSSSSVSGSASCSSSDPSDPRTSVSPGTPTITSASTSTQTYDLYRGRTSALIDAPSVVWGRDGRWVGVGTRNRTVHVFAVNPYGGRADLRSHLDRTRDAEVLEPPMTQIPALVRIRGSKGLGSPSYMTVSPPAPSSAHSDFAQARSKDNAPLAFTFISPADLNSTSPNLLPPSSPGFSSPRIPPSSLSPSSPTFSPRLGGRPASRGGASTTSAPIYGSGNEYPYQDILVFDPLDGALSLRRLTLGKQPVNDTALPLGLGVGVGVAASAAASAIGMVTSVSLPGRGGAGRLSASSSPSSRTPVVGIGSGRNLSGGSDGRGKAQGVQESEMELIAKASVVATWDLRRARDWVEVRVPIVPKAGAGRRAGAAKIGGTGDWLAQGELSTHSVSPRLLPRSLYLSHQFLFHTLGEDYHALLRGYQFDVSASGGSRRIEVRKEVEVSGGFVGAVGGTGVTRDDSAFIQDFSFSPQDAHSNAHMRRMPSSFDEPLASAISGTLLNSSSAIDVPAVLPMYPNGIPGTSTSLRNSRAVQIPMRTMAGIGDGVSEGLGRIRRGVGRVREKDGRISEREKRVIEDVQVPIPLEFDEEDEDFSGGPQPPSFPTTTHASGVPISSRDTARSTGGDSTSVSSFAIATPASASSSSHALNMDMDSDVVGRVDEEIWGDAPRGGLLEAEEDGWDRQDRLAIEEAEGYDDLALAAAMEALEPVKPAPAPPNPVPAGNLKKKGKKKRV